MRVTTSNTASRPGGYEPVLAPPGAQVVPLKKAPSPDGVDSRDEDGAPSGRQPDERGRGGREDEAGARCPRCARRARAEEEGAGRLSDTRLRHLTLASRRKSLAPREAQTATPSGSASAEVAWQLVQEAAAMLRGETVAKTDAEAAKEAEAPRAYSGAGRQDNLLVEGSPASHSGVAQGGASEGASPAREGGAYSAVSTPHRKVGGGAEGGVEKGPTQDPEKRRDPSPNGSGFWGAAEREKSGLPGPSDTSDRDGLKASPDGPEEAAQEMTGNAPQNGAHSEADRRRASGAEDGPQEPRRNRAPGHDDERLWELLFLPDLVDDDRSPTRGIVFDEVV